ncbi:unnamed protein product [Cuscuta europaea]|uniref:Translation initiation factor 5A C-terminal domain-containing protein n=1 Tax=Cuscuta europaea TaxID=41803 RepID=A0A9P1EEQ8_CUSEU|nr:unnamed protein product [Cuscuta europaea]
MAQNMRAHKDPGFSSYLMKIGNATQVKVYKNKVSLLDGKGNTKDDLRLPTNETLCGQIKSAFEDGKDNIVSVMSAMGEEQICGLKDLNK